MAVLISTSSTSPCTCSAGASAGNVDRGVVRPAAVAVASAGTGCVRFMAEASVESAKDSSAYEYVALENTSAGPPPPPPAVAVAGAASGVADALPEYCEGPIALALWPLVTSEQHA